MQRSSSTHRTRLRILSAGFVLLALILVGRLYIVQIVHGHGYAQDALGQYVSEDVTSESRGSIYFTTKDGQLVAAAATQTGWRLAIVPKDLTDPTAAYTALSPYTSIDKARFFTSAGKKSDPYEEIALHLDDATAKRIRALKMPGVLLVQDQWRTYPGKRLGAQTVGFIGYRGDSKIGLYGLERAYQDTLAFDNDGRSVNPFAEIFANIHDALALDPTAREGSIVTSIEPSVQQEVEDTLDGVMKTYTPRMAGAIVMDPHTGAIVAMAVRPTFDPNTYNLAESAAVFTNPLVEGRYELGSIMKPLTMAAGIDSGAVTPQTKYTDAGCITRSGARICNFDLKARGVVPMQEILSQSLNTGVTFVEEKMGHDAFARYMKAYGFGEKTGIDLPNEVTGDIRSLDGNVDVEFANASFGQGVAVSPIAMIRALSVLANAGMLPTPHVVRAIKYESGLTRTVSPAPGKQVLKPETADVVSSMLSIVFDKALLKGELYHEHHSFAAKTGTAQMAMPGGGYYPDRYLHSFFGYFPAHDPKFIVFLFAVEPHGVQYASASLAHPFMDIADFLVNYYAIAPDR